MTTTPIRTTVVGSYPFPGWLEFATQHLNKFGAADIEEMIEDAVIAAIHDQVAAGLDVITDGEQTRLDFNLSFYGFIKGIENNETETRRFGPAAHDQRGKNNIVGDLEAPFGLGAVKEFLRLKKLAPAGPVLKASVPGPYTLSGRLLPNQQYKDRFDITEALLPIISGELEALVAAGCTEITVDEPSMSCYAYKEDTKKFVDIFNRTVKPVVGRCNLSTHLCFGNFKGRPVGYRSIKPMLPDFLDMTVDEIHIEMANREFAEIELLAAFAEKMNVAVGIIDVKNYYIETVADVVERINRCLKYVPAQKLSVAPDCGLSQTARWASRQKLNNMVLGAKKSKSRFINKYMDIEIFKDYHGMSAAAADIIIDIVQRKPDAVLCFATGNTPVLTYQLLAEKAAVQKVDFSKCFCIGLDEWLGIPADKSGTCSYLLHQQVFTPLGIKEEQLYLFDGMTADVEATCKKMNDLIDSKGGIDCMLAGIGLNGHIGFNEPGVDMSLQAHEQKLHTTTLESGQHYFNEPTQIKEGITLGMAQVMKTGGLLLLANGKSKAAIIKKALEEEVTNQVPASFIQQHENGLVMLDKEAASELSK